ncbi:hypothetical protein Patl1_36308 [Pistacia atlantica]|nr:hypothetical protein Patl1_36308 [Pistacia atlantica]
MGICSSCEATNVATMAKVILQDGRLQEFACPVKVSQVLEKNPSCFLSNMDDMDFDSFISTINGDEDLQPGRLYFALPMSWLKSPLRGEKMASLVVKASLALKKRKGGGGRHGDRKYCGSCRVKTDDVLMYTTAPRVLDPASPKVVVGSGGGRGSRSGSRGSMVRQRRQGGGSLGRGRGRGHFATKLSVIIEEKGDDHRS